MAAALDVALANPGKLVALTAILGGTNLFSNCSGRSTGQQTERLAQFAAFRSNVVERLAKLQESSDRLDAMQQ